MLKQEIMDLAIEFSELKEGQRQILQMLKKGGSSNSETLKVYTLDELAKFFSVTKRTIYNWKDEGRLPFSSIGSKTYVTSVQLTEFLKANEVKSIKLGRV